MQKEQLGMFPLATATSCKRHHLWLSRVLILRLIWPPPKPRQTYEVITRVKSYCATETDVQGGKKSWQKISVVSLERICQWEGIGREQGEERREGRRVKQELGPKRKRKDSKSKNLRERKKSSANKTRPCWDKIDQKLQRVSEEMWRWQRWSRERDGERGVVLIEEVKDIFSGSRPSWCLYRTAAGVRSLFQPWRQLEVSTPRQPQLCLPTKLSHVFVHTAAPLSQQEDTMLAQVPLHPWDFFKKMEKKLKHSLSKKLMKCQSAKTWNNTNETAPIVWQLGFETLRQYTNVLNG